MEKIRAYNEVEKRKQALQRKKEREEQVRLQEEYNRILDKQEQQRKEEVAKREEKIKNLMDRMGEVVKKTDEAEKALDLQILNAALKKGREAEELEKEKARKFVLKNKQLYIGLKEQVDAKQRKREQERRKNEDFVQMVLKKDK